MSASYMKVRKQQYTKKSAPPRLKKARRESAWGSDGRRKKARLLNSLEGLKELQGAKYVEKKPSVCPKCKREGTLTDPQGRSDKAEGYLYHRCRLGYDTCGARINCLSHSKIPLTKMTPGQLHCVVDEYSNSDNLRPPSSDDIAGKCGGGQIQVKKVVDFLQGIDAEQGMQDSKKATVGGDVEVDEHCVRTVHISVNNKHYEHLAPKKVKKLPKYWLCYVRVIGLRRRGGGKTILKFLPVKLLRPRAKPPPLSKQDREKYEAAPPNQLSGAAWADHPSLNYSLLRS